MSDSNQPCEDDSDCGSEYYCYKTSKKCVNFTDCLQYNRVEGVTQARSATQCGACRAGYVAEILANGKETELCRKDVTDVQHYPKPTTDSTTNLYIGISVFFISFIIFGVVICFMRKRYCKISCLTRNDVENTDVAPTTNTTKIDGLMTASAPLEEQSPFIELAEDKHHIHNNNRPTVNNEYQTARVTVLPQWEFVPARVRRCILMPNINRTVSFFNNVPDADVPNERNIVAQLQNNIPNNQSTTSLILPEANIEQEDNARNTTLLQTHPPDSDTNSSPESNKKNNKKENNFTINQSVNQGVTLNMNFFNENDY